MDASTSSTHMPRSIFPDIPASRRAATITPNYADTGLTSPAPPPLNTRRHTTQFLPTRREARPLRSSPLAGPSLALTQDGILAVSEAEKKLAASREAFAGDVTAESAATEVASPTSECSSSGHALSAPEPHTRTEPAPDGSMSSRIRRLSLGFKRKSFQAPPAQSDSAPRPRRASSSSSHSHSQEDAPPVPQLPQWARGAVKRSVTEPSTPTDKHTHRQSHHPRRSTSPTMPTSDPVKVARRTSLLPSQLPNTSRNPEENWMTSASAPRFSRLSLKADGVVMPVSVKEARRRSTASLSSRMSASDVRGLKGKQSTRSLRSVHPASETAKRLAEDAEMQPPRPLFRGDSNASSSSLGSSITDTDSILTETRSISRMSSMTDGELPLPHGYAEEGKSTSTLELRINDVTIDMINYEHMEHVESPRSFTEMELTTIAEVEAREVKGVAETGVETTVVESPAPTKVKRRGTLKKVWNRVVRSVTG